MIKFMKNDFWTVKEALECIVGRKVPIGLFILYYIVVGLIALPFGLVVWVYLRIKFYFIFKELKKKWREEI